jgi:hypothetical protein
MSKKTTSSKSSKSQVKFLGEGRDEFKRRYFKFALKSRNVDIPPFAADVIAEHPTQLFAVLTNAGWNAFTRKVRDAFLQRLQALPETPEKPSFRVATRLGWNSGAFVFPDEVVGKPTDPLEPAFGGLDQAMRSKYRVRGTLEQWQQKIAVPCDGNSRLMFAVSLAFTGPILRFVAGPKAGGFQIWGKGESGKTTAAMVAGSVWGCHVGEGRREKGFAESWNSTANKVEVTALAHNDGLLILDETKRAGNDSKEQAKVVSKVSFGLAEHTEKERLSNTHSVRSWRCYFLSTSNLSLEQLGRAGGIHIDEADRGRLVDVPLPSEGHGIFEELHHFPSGQKLADKLQRGARMYYGTPIREFVRRLVHDRQSDAPELKDFLKGERQAYLLALEKKTEALRPLNRASGRFATVFAAGSLAIHYGILLWERKKLLRAVLRCQLDQLRLGDDDTSRSSGTDGLRSKLSAHLKAHHRKFMNLGKRRPRWGIDQLEDVPGYRTKKKGQWHYFLTAKQLAEIIGKGTDALALRRTLAAEGNLAKSPEGRFSVERRIFRGGKGKDNFRRVCEIRQDICTKPSD